ncbi:hypothetical protein [Longispora albida]|uniref:hypothetical protein n=1 Tax=Longispora albida TaxID=203523 RepID=UPI0003754836|nr:hypothetical protein [Longispora albida]
MVRLARTAAAILLAVAGSVAALATPAQAAVIDASCVPPSYNVTAFNPPLTTVLAPTTLTYKTTYRPCTSQTSNLSYGFTNITVNMNDQCQMVLQTFVMTYTIHWNNGQSSTIQATRTASISGSTLTVTLSGQVIGGLFTGSRSFEQQVGSAVDLQNCLAGISRLSSTTGKVTLRIWH